MKHLAHILVCFMPMVYGGYNVNGGLMGDNNIFNGNLKYQQCGGLKSIINLVQLNTHPLQFYVSQNVSMSISFNITQDIISPVKFKIKLHKRLPILGYVKIPCIANYGSCTFDNTCAILETYPHDSFAYKVACPNWLQATGFKCKCPLHKGAYSASNVKVPIQDTIVPRWIAAGNYKVLLTITNANQVVGCFKFQFRLN